MAFKDLFTYLDITGGLDQEPRPQYPTSKKNKKVQLRFAAIVENILKVLFLYVKKEKFYVRMQSLNQFYL